MTLFFDTETNGKADFKLPPEHDSQPRLVQLAAVLCDADLQPVIEMNVLIEPVGFTISEEVTKIHGITHDYAVTHGINERLALDMFQAMCRKAKRLVAHNIAFDGIVIGRANHINGLAYTPPEPYCTMKAALPVCKIPSQYPGQYKWPSLQEAHQILLGQSFDNAHDAMADVRACLRIYEHLIHGDRPKARPAEPVTTRSLKVPIPQEQPVEDEYDDETPMPFGKYKGTPLGKLPESYAQWLYQQDSLSDRRLMVWLHGK
jgi:DNA polymerase III subunit epsilon